MTIEQLREDKRAELGNEFYDTVNYTGLVIMIQMKKLLLGILMES